MWNKKLNDAKLLSFFDKIATMLNLCVKLLGFFSYAQFCVSYNPLENTYGARKGYKLIDKIDIISRDFTDCATHCQLRDCPGFIWRENNVCQIGQDFKTDPNVNEEIFLGIGKSF